MNSNSIAGFESQQITAGDGSSFDRFGSSVSLNDDRAIVGAYSDDENGFLAGSAYIYERSTAGVWVEIQKLTASSNSAFDHFGQSVSLSGDRALVGAWQDDNVGSAYIFERNASGVWTEVQKLTASDSASEDRFGLSVSISGDRAIVGSYADDDDGNASGSAYIFERAASGVWVQMQKLTASDAATIDTFGRSVSLSGDFVIVGASQNDDNGANSGSAYIFELNASGVWIETPKLTPNDGASADYFGNSVAISGHRAIIGAFRDDDNGADSGSAYIYERGTSGVWLETQKLTASNGGQVDFFGNSVSLLGDRAIVGASGPAYVYEQDVWGVWVETRKLIASDVTQGNGLVPSVSLSANQAFVGAPNDDGNEIDSGSAYSYDLIDTPEIISPISEIVLSSTTQKFEWEINNPNIKELWFYLGSQPGSLDYHNSGNLPSTTLTATVSGLPDDGSFLYAKLWYRVNGDITWYFIEKTYTAFGITPTITSPISGAALAGATDTFTWQNNGASLTNTWVDIGSSIGGIDYYRSGQLNNASSVTADGLPTDGNSSIYVRLWYQLGSQWKYLDEAYTAGTAGAAVPTIDSPVPSSQLTDITGTETIAWQENGYNGTEYWVYAGSTQGSSNYAQSGSLGDVLTTTITGLPTNGSSVWVRLWYRSAPNGSWSSVDAQYTAVTVGNLPTISASTGDGTLTSPTDSFTFNDPNGNVSGWWLYVGSSVGGSEYDDSGNLNGATSYAVNGLPTGGVPVYVRLWYREGTDTTWSFIDAVFSSAP